MIVIGGTYEEYVTVPAYEEVAGSGLRAAAALRSQGRVNLATALDGAMDPVARSVFKTLSIDAAVVERNASVGFRYFSPVTTPLVAGTLKYRKQPFSSLSPSTNTSEPPNAATAGGRITYSVPSPPLPNACSGRQYSLAIFREVFVRKYRHFTEIT